MKPSYERWTEDEMKILKENYLKCPVELISKRLGRSIGSIKSKALSLGYSRRSGRRPVHNYRYYKFEDTGIVVYFLESSDGFIKIGRTRTDRLNWRFDEIQASNQHDLTYKVVIEGPKKLERIYQSYFYLYHFKREWFKKEGLLQQFVDNQMGLLLPFEEGAE